MSEKSEEEKKAEMVMEKLKESEDRTDFRVYNCPVELKNELVSMAKLHYDNEMWKVIADGLELLKKEKDGEFEERYAELEGRVSRLEEELKLMSSLDKNTRNEEQKESKDRKLGLGESPPDSDIDALKNIKGEN